MKRLMPETPVSLTTAELTAMGTRLGTGNVGPIIWCTDYVGGAQYVKWNGTTWSALDTTGGGGSADVNQIELNFGSIPTRNKKFTFTATGAISGQQVILQHSYDAPTGRSVDENEFADFIIRASVSATNQITAYISSIGFVQGLYKFNWMVG